MSDLAERDRSITETADRFSDDERHELETYRTAFAAIRDVCARAGQGDLEARVPILDGDGEIHAVRDSVNHLLDLTDAFVREAGASLQAASEGRLHRAFLPNGMLGSFREGARTVDQARLALKESSVRLDDAKARRLTLADEFQSVVLSATEEVVSATEQVASASTELVATAASLTKSAGAAMLEVDQAAGTIATLDDTSQRIRQVVTLINQVAGQTRLLALNATIEATRAGEAGKGFTVVANEVKELAGQTSAATARIEQEVAAVQAAAAQSGKVLKGIARTVRDMHAQVLEIAAAVDGAQDSSVDFAGLSELAELLRRDVMSFLDDLRG
jgi:methyl-accepting chemotaxis protein